MFKLLFNPNICMALLYESVLLTLTDGNPLPVSTLLHKTVTYQQTTQGHKGIVE